MAYITESLSVKYGTKAIPAVFTIPSGGPGTTCIVLTHGAGGDMNSEPLVLLAQALAGNGVAVLRFTCKGLNLNYRTKVYTKVVEFLLSSSYGIKSCFLAGRSMGSRAAVNVAKDNESFDISASILGVICLSYPLYPPKSPLKMRDAPLYELPCPVIFISGDSDDMCRKDRMEGVITRLREADMHWVNNAGHDLIDKSRGLQGTINMVADKVFQWCSKICPRLVLSVASERKYEETPPVTSAVTTSVPSSSFASGEDNRSSQAEPLVGRSYKRMPSRKRKRSVGLLVKEFPDSQTM